MATCDVCEAATARWETPWGDFVCGDECALQVLRDNLAEITIDDGGLYRGGDLTWQEAPVCTLCQVRVAEWVTPEGEPICDSNACLLEYAMVYFDEVGE